MLSVLLISQSRSPPILTLSHFTFTLHTLTQFHLIWPPISLHFNLFCTDINSTIDFRSHCSQGFIHSLPSPPIFTLPPHFLTFVPSPPLSLPLCLASHQYKYSQILFSHIIHRFELNSSFIFQLDPPETIQKSSLLLSCAVSDKRRWFLTQSLLPSWEQQSAVIWQRLGGLAQSAGHDGDDDDDDDDGDDDD